MDMRRGGGGGIKWGRKLEIDHSFTGYSKPKKVKDFRFRDKKLNEIIARREERKNELLDLFSQIQAIMF